MKSCSFLVFPLLISHFTQAQERPNIILIMADDMGYSDLGCYGGEIDTPNLDQLAEQGIRFTQFYNSTRCCPTRASLMTGLYPHEAGMGYMTGVNAGSGYEGFLNDSCITIPEVLSKAGYFTTMSGKWHAGAVQKSWPENRGFDRFFGIHHWVNSYFKVLEDCEIYEDSKIVIPPEETPELYAEEGREWYTTDVFTTKAIEYIDESLKQGKPFFQYIAYNAPHWPLEAHDEVIDKYLERYSMGYEVLRKEKYEHMRKMGIINQNWNLPEQVTPEWDSHNDSAKLDMEFRRAIYAAQIEIMDWNIGRLVDHLKEKNVLDNTVIIFLSDNGCSAEPMNTNYGFQWAKNTRWNYPEWRKNSNGSSSQGRIWSIASNSPFRMYKIFTYEGGISTPLIIHWPDGIKNRGRLDNKISHIMDIMATCIDLAGASYPTEINGVPVIQTRGISLVDNLKGNNGKEHEFIFWEHEGNGALRKGNWKIVSSNAKDQEKWELFNMETDRTETQDLSETLPELRKEMIDKWVRLAYDLKVLPWPDYRTAKKNPVDK